MKLPRLPLWLLCDVVAFVGAQVSFVRLGLAAAALNHRMIAEGWRRPTDAEINEIAPLFADAESWLHWAIRRHAFRLAGLDPGKVDWIAHAIPTHRLAFSRRLRLFMRHNTQLDRLARQQAAKLRRLLTILSSPASVSTLRDETEGLSSGADGAIWSSGPNRGANARAQARAGERTPADRLQTRLPAANRPLPQSASF